MYMYVTMATELKPRTQALTVTVLSFFGKARERGYLITALPVPSDFCTVSRIAT